MASSRFLSSASSLIKLLQPTVSTTLRTVASPSASAAKLRHFNLSPTLATSSTVRTFQTIRSDLGNENPPILKIDYYDLESKPPHEVDGDDEAMYMRFKMPGVENEGLKLWVGEKLVWFQGGEMRGDNNKSPRRYPF